MKKEEQENTYTLPAEMHDWLRQNKEERKKELRKLREEKKKQDQDE
ncbi:hypothetical protein [Halobacillus salinus]|nr:hypothetical protein [Halobacillus salinus]